MADISITDDLILKIHTGSDGRIWFLDGDRLPEDSRQTIDTFLDSEVVRKADKVRVVGSPGNADLLLILYARKLREELVSVEVCSPLLCQKLGDPEQVLMDLRKAPALSASLGGWHEFTASDQCSWRLAKAHREGKSNCPELKNHLAWYALAAVPHLCPHTLSRLIGEIIDPRFYIDVDEPDRTGKLESYLGMAPKSSSDRYKYLMAWKNTDPGAVKAKAVPELFIWDEYHRTEGGLPKKTLRASQKFLHYLRHVWLDALYPNPPWMERLFAPDLFFSDPSRVAWFQRLPR